MMNKIKLWFAQFGIFPYMTIRAFRELPRLFRDYKEFKHCAKGWAVRFNYPCLHDRRDCAGTMSGHYFHQDLYVARKIYGHMPIRHVDIGSRLDGFVAHVATFRDIEVFDIRVGSDLVPGITFRKVDLMKNPDLYDNYTDSLSCLHALEHFGLGRYGDPIDPDGHLKGLSNMLRILKTGGRFYLSVPMGSERVEFNGHRVFSVRTILSMCSMLTLEKFAWVGDDGKFRIERDLTVVKKEDFFEQTYGLAIFIFLKKV